MYDGLVQSSGQRTVAVLNSSQPKHPRCDATWVRATLRAVDQLASEGHAFVTSVGLPSWELTLWRAGALGAELLVVGPLPRGRREQDASARVCQEFSLDPARTRWVSVISGAAKGRMKDSWQARDELCVELADVVAPVSIRPRGRMAELLDRPAIRAKHDDRFVVPYDAHVVERRWGEPPPCHERGQVPEELLVHLTRSSDGLWPAERSADFYRALAEGSTGYPRDGFSTLCRIVRERRIRGSSLRIRGAATAVSLTSLDPWDALRLVRWRTQFARYSFEPYLVGVPLDAAQERGARPVIYDGGAGTAPELADQVLRQGRGEEGRWEAEQEWRVPGDLDLAGLELVAFTATDEEASMLRGACGCRVVSFGWPTRGDRPRSR